MRALRDLRGVLAGEGEEESRLRLGVLGVGGGEREEKRLPVVMLGLLVRREEARVRRRLGVWKVLVWLGLEWEEDGGEEKDEGEVEAGVGLEDGDELAGAEMRVGRESLTGTMYSTKAWQHVFECRDRVFSKFISEVFSCPIQRRVRKRIDHIPTKVVGPNCT